MRSTNDQERLSTYIRPCKEPILHAERAMHLHLTPNVRRVCTHIWSCRNQSYSPIRMAPSPRLSYLVTDQAPPFPEWNSSLNSDHVGTNPTVTSEWLSTHIWHGRNQSSPWQNGSTLTSDLLVKMAMDLSTHIWHGRNQSSHHDRMAQKEPILWPW